MAFIFGKDDPRRLEDVWEVQDLREIDDKDSTYKQIAEDLNVEKLVGIPSQTLWYLIRKANPEIFEQLPPEPKDLETDSLDYVFSEFEDYDSDSYRKQGGKPFTIERGRVEKYPGTEEEYFNTYLDSILKYPEKVDTWGMAVGEGQIHRDDFDRAQKYKEWQENKEAKRRYEDALRRILGK